MTTPIDDKWVREFDPCKDAKAWLAAREDRDAIRCIEAVMAMGRKDWALWAIPRCLNRKNRILYAVYASELVLPNYAAFNADTFALTACHAAARAVAENDTEENRSAAESAWSARSARSSAWSSSAAAAEAAWSAAWSAAAAAAEAAWSAAWSAELSSAAAAAAWSLARSVTEDKIIAEGMRLLREQEGVPNAN